MPPRFLALIVLFSVPLMALAQAPAAQAPVERSTTGAERAEGDDKDFRNTAGYPFPAPSRTVRDMQNLAHAMELRAYCADERVPDAFVKDRLARFSRISGRKESCRSLLDY